MGTSTTNTTVANNITNTNTIAFTKMHGLGNDFVVIDGINQTVELNTERLKQIADRNLGIGCDQILLVESCDKPEAEFVYRIFNADGSEVEHCGNGARCFAQFVREQKLTNSTDIKVITKGGLLNLHVRDDGFITVAMGEPIFTPNNIPFITSETYTENTLDFPLPLAEKTVRVAALAIGNPHAVLQVDDIETAPVATYGPQIEAHVQFPNRVNAGFVQVVDRETLKLRVYERGVGETLACGTGACAAMIAAKRWGLVDSNVTVHLPGGTLDINWEGPAGSNAANTPQVFMSGPATTVFSGVYTFTDTNTAANTANTCINE